MSFAEKQMKKMGWKEGQGLGKDETGSTDYIKVTVKNNSLGIGAPSVSSDTFGFQWWDHAFNKAAQNISVDTSKDKVQIKSNKDFERSDLVTTSRPMKSEKELKFGAFVKSGEDANLSFVDYSSKLTDKELFEKCGGRTAHASDRGVGMGGKVKRVSGNDEKLERKKRRKEEKKRQKLTDSGDTSNLSSINKKSTKELKNSIKDDDKIERKRRRKEEKRLAKEEANVSSSKASDSTSEKDLSMKSLVKKQKKERKLSKNAQVNEIDVDKLERKRKRKEQKQIE